MNELIDKLDDWNRMVDVRLKEKLRVVLDKDGWTPTCSSCEQPGCCYQTIYEPFYAALPIARRLKLSGLDTPELRETLRTVGNRMKVESRKVFFDSVTPCPLLVDRRCSVYEERPISCRRHFSFSPAEMCQPPTAPDDLTLLNSLDIASAGIEVSNKIHTLLGLKSSPRRIYFGAFPLMVLIALEATDEGVDFCEHVRRQSWPTVDDLDELAKREVLI